VKRILIPAAAAALVFLSQPPTPREAVVEYVVYLDVMAGVSELIDQHRRGD
jgi:hypothetical protein